MNAFVLVAIEDRPLASVQSFLHIVVASVASRLEKLLLEQAVDGKDFHLFERDPPDHRRVGVDVAAVTRPGPTDVGVETGGHCDLRVLPPELDLALPVRIFPDGEKTQGCEFIVVGRVAVDDGRLSREEVYLYD